MSFTELFQFYYYPFICNFTEKSKSENYFINENIFINIDEKKKLINENIITAFATMNKKKSILFEQFQNNLFLDTCQANFGCSHKFELFDIKDIFSRKSNDILTDVDGCILEYSNISNYPTIYIIETKSRFDKIKIDTKILQIYEFVKSLQDVFYNEKSKFTTSRKFNQMIKKYNLKDKFIGLNFKIIFSYQYIDKYCIEYLDLINNNLIEDSYEDITFKMFQLNNNYLYLVKKDIKFSKCNNFRELKELLYLCPEFNTSAIERFLNEYENLKQAFTYFSDKIGYMNSKKIYVNRKLLVNNN
jgi:hypothetical protein